LVNEACETKEGHNILSLAIVDLKKKRKRKAFIISGSAKLM